MGAERQRHRAFQTDQILRDRCEARENQRRQTGKRFVPCRTASLVGKSKQKQLQSRLERTSVRAEGWAHLEPGIPGRLPEGVVANCPD